MKENLSTLLGAIAFQVGEKKYSVNITGSEKFAHELRQAIARGQDPAEALFFLVELGATLYHPDNPMLSHNKARVYEQFFGAHGGGGNAPKRILTLVH